MSEQVKRYDPINSDGTCGICVEDPDYGDYVEFADYDALHAENARLREQVKALQSDANSWQAGYDKGREDGAKAAEGWKAQHARDSAELRRLCSERDTLRAELAALKAPAVEREAPSVVATVILGGLYHGGSGPELGEIDIDVCMPALETIQCETVNCSDDVFLPLMTVAQHERIVASLTRPAQTAPLAIPDECPHMIVFDDAERENELFAGCGARPAAMRRFEQISQSWNAHLFVRIEKNSRDAPYPCATTALQPADGLVEALAGLPDVCDGLEQEAFEDYARKEGMDMRTHPLHWLFLDKETYAARKGWRAAIRYCREAMAAHRAQGNEE